VSFFGQQQHHFGLIMHKIKITRVTCHPNNTSEFFCCFLSFFSMMMQKKKANERKKKEK